MNILQQTQYLASRGKNLLRSFEKIDRQAEPVFLLTLTLVVIVFTWLRISGTSVGTYYQYFYGTYQTDPNLVWGQPRPIRADEFRVSTSWTAAQAERGFPQYNDLFGLSGQTLFFYDVPVKDFTLIFRPHMWAFLFLPLENAFAYKWWFRGALLILSIYLLFRRFTKQRVLISIFASLALFFSPFFQWWYSQSLLDTATYFLLLYETFIRLIEYRRKSELYFYAGLFGYICVALVFFFYPPALVSMGWVFVILAGGYIWYRRDLLTRERLSDYLRAGGASALICGAFVLALYWQYQSVFNLINNTLYPGKRTIPVGGVNWETLLGGFFNIQLLQTPITIPRIFPSNESEASGFFMWGVFLIPVMLFLLVWEYRHTRRVAFWSVLITVTFLIILIWINNPPPLSFAALFFMSKVPSFRMIMALGAVNFVLIFWYLFGAAIPTNKWFGWVCVGYAVAVFLFYLGFGYYLKNSFPGFIVIPAKIFAIALFAGLAFYLLLQKRAGLFITLLFAFSFLSSYSVNPLYQGLGELTHGQLANAIREINQQDGGKSRWVLYDSRLTNFLQANGVKGLSNVYYYPDFALYKVLDPTGKSIEAYNRYSHAMFVPEDNTEPRFDPVAVDGYGLYINPCSDALRALKVKYQVFKNPSDFSCLHEVKQIEYPQGSYFIYEYK